MSGAGPVLTLTPTGPADGALVAPASKSVTNRLLVQAALAEGTSVLHRPLDSDDAQAMIDGIAALGAAVRRDGDALVVTGTSGRPRAPHAPIDCRLSGTTIRFLTAVATLADGPVTLTGAPSLRRRPIGALADALASLGSTVTADGGLPPVHVTGGGLSGGRVTVDVTGSSQFASALLLAAPCAHEPVEVVVSGVAAERYIELTAVTMREWSALVTVGEPGTWRVEPDGYAAREVTVEYDASAAAHLMAVAAATGGRVTVVGTAPATLQPDVAITDVLAQMGCRVERTVRGDLVDVTVTGPEHLAPLDVDLTGFPDQVTTVAALAALADGTSTLTGAAVARGHETDRLAALATELGKLGVDVAEHRDGLVIRGGTAHGPAVLDTHDDHRLAMCFAAIAARVPDVGIADPGCVAKTYPGFWDDLATLGVGVGGARL